MVVFLFFRCQLQVLVQVLATVIEGGTVGDTFPVSHGKCGKRPPSGFVTVEEAADATEFSTRQSALPVTPSVTAERKSMKPSNTRHSSAGMSFAFTSDTDFGGMQPLKYRLLTS